VRRTRTLVVAGTVAVVLVAVGAISALTRDPKRTYVLPRCATPAHAIQPPSPFPRALPLPDGTVFSTSVRYPAQIVVGGRAPLELIPAVRFLIRELPRKGFRLGQGESEPGLEAESGFVGHGVVGRFRVRVLPRCRGAVLLVVAVSRARAGILPTSPTPVSGVLPACSGAGSSAGSGAGVASGLPPSFPLPAGTVVRSSRQQTIRATSFHFVNALAPTTIGGAAQFILHRLPKAGYRLAEADRETNEAEAAFAGHGVHGRIRFHTLLACTGALTVDIVTTNKR
jgi:hypothetical protein